MVYPTREVSRRGSGRRGPLLSLGSIILAAIFGVFSGPLPALAAVAPDTGPTAGGTAISDLLPASHRVVQTGGNLGTSVALTADGELYTWGSNTYGQLGNGSTEDSVEPVRVNFPEGVIITSVATGSMHSIATGSDGNLYAWGDNSAGQLGVGNTETARTPQRVRAPEGITLTSVHATVVNSVALGSDGNVYSWGSNLYGQLGTGDTEGSSLPIAAQTPGDIRYSAVTAGRNFTIALGSDRLAYSWGQNQNGQLGSGNLLDSALPVAVVLPEDTTFTRIDAGNAFAIAQGANGITYSWGQNNSGQLGNGTNNRAEVPTRVIAPAESGMTIIQAGSEYVIALDAAGTVFGWGTNVYGQLGNGSVRGSSTPVPVSVPEGVVLTSLSANYYHVLALAEDGSLYAWGRNGSGELGNGETTTSRLPVRVLWDETRIIAVDLGGEAATGPSQEGPRWTATTPAHACGPVDVTVSYSYFGLIRESVQLAGFTYGSAPQILTHPASATATEPGQEITLSAEATGDDAPTIAWEQRAPGVSWAAVPDAHGPTLLISPAETREYRAVFSNCLGTINSEPALITVPGDPSTPPGETASPNPGGTPGLTPGPTDPLAQTGAEGFSPWGLAALALIGLGAAALGLVRGRRRA